MRTKTPGRDFLVLWKWEEALRVQGEIIRSARGTHSGGLNPGDRMFVWAVHGEELHLLGAIRVKRSGKNWAEGKNLYGPFKIIPLKGLKWRIRFAHTSSKKLARQTKISMQVRARRRPTPETVELLEKLLSDKARNLKQLETDITAREGKLQVLTLSRRERSSKLRSRVLGIKGLLCEICGFDFAELYGDFAKLCVEIHHLKPVSSSGRHGRTTTLDDLIVVCPNCHRALHHFEDSSDVRAFQRACDLS